MQHYRCCLIHERKLYWLKDIHILRIKPILQTQKLVFGRSNFIWFLGSKELENLYHTLRKKKPTKHQKWACVKHEHCYKLSHGFFRPRVESMSSILLMLSHCFLRQNSVKSLETKILEPQMHAILWVMWLPLSVGEMSQSWRKIGQISTVIPAVHYIVLGESFEVPSDSLRFSFFWVPWWVSP